MAKGLQLSDALINRCEMLLRQRKNVVARRLSGARKLQNFCDLFKRESKALSFPDEGNLLNSSF